LRLPVYISTTKRTGRVMRLTLVWASLIGVVGFLMPAHACERPASSEDVCVDTKGEELRIVIVNVSDACTSTRPLPITHPPKQRTRARPAVE
jgi:hypothetical protein